MKLRRFLFWVLLAAVGMFVWGCAGGSATETRLPIPVTVLFFNDLHGYLQPFVIKTDTGKAEVGGIARLAALAKKSGLKTTARGQRPWCFSPETCCRAHPCQRFSTAGLTWNVSTLVEKIDVLDSVLTVRKSAEPVKDKGPVILLSHSKHKTNRAIAAAVPEITAIIGGHDQILLSPFQKVGDVPVFQAFEKGRYLGRIAYPSV